MHFSERSNSVWKVAQPALMTAALTDNTTADVCIVGAGIAGLSVAYELSRAGKQVIVLDDNAIGGGETAQTTAHLSTALDDRYFEIERLHGAEGARLAYQSHHAAIARIEHIVREQRIDCDFERIDGYLFLDPKDSPRLLKREGEAARRAGAQGVELLSQTPQEGFSAGTCLRFPRQAQFDPLRYVAGLADAIANAGGRIHTGTHVNEIADGRVVTSTGLSVEVKAIVIATNTPINDRFAIHTKQEPYRTFVIAMQLPARALKPALYWDTGDPYHYVRLHRADEPGALLIVGGEDHKTGHEDDAEARFARLESWARERVAMAGAVKHRWSGQVLEPFDGMAFIGRSPGASDNVYVATGDSGNGMTHGVIAGILIADLVLERSNAWEELYNPSRKTLRAAKTYALINASVAWSYADWLKAGDVSSWTQIKPESGAVVRHGMHKLAVYRNQEGALHVCSAVCPHLGGVVHWNSQERSWDCPCHGSRFSPQGEVLNGPALHGLKQMAQSDLLPDAEPLERKRTG